VDPARREGDRLILVSDHSLQLSSAASLQSTWLGERTEWSTATLSRADGLSSRPPGHLTPPHLPLTTASCTFPIPRMPVVATTRPAASAELLSCTLNGPQRPELKARAHPNNALPCPRPTVPLPHILPFSLLHTHVATLGSRALCRFHPFDTLALSSTAKHSSRHSFTLESWEFLLRFRFRTTSLSQAAASASLHVASTSHAPLIDQVTETRRPFPHP
jgi:hypothetical protein